MFFYIFYLNSNKKCCYHEFIKGFKNDIMFQEQENMQEDMKKQLGTAHRFQVYCFNINLAVALNLKY